MEIKDLKKQLGITDKEISIILGYSNPITYRTSSAKKRYEKALIDFYRLIKSAPVGTEVTSASIALNYGKVIYRYSPGGGWLKVKVDSKVIAEAERLGKLCQTKFRFKT